MAHEKREIWVAAQIDTYGDVWGSKATGSLEEAKALIVSIWREALLDPSKNTELVVSWDYDDTTEQWTAQAYVVGKGETDKSEEELQDLEPAEWAVIWKAGEI